MALELPKQITDIASGADKDMAGTLNQVRNGVAVQTVVLQLVEQDLQNLKVLQDTTGLPDVPDVLTIQGQAANIQGLVDVQLQTLDSLPGGACLRGALNAVVSVANDGYGFISEQIYSLVDLAGVPADVMNISGLYSQVRELTASLKLDEYVAGALGTLGCLEDDTQASAELASLMNTLGMNSSGQVTDEDFQASMMSDLAIRADAIGINPAYITGMSDSMGEMSKMADGYAGQAKDASKSTIDDAKQAIKDSVSKIPTPPSIF
jgi:hypothetical protein